jgi:ubiquinone/menaquinone biosynthesis C-methylase UbiE
MSANFSSPKEVVLQMGLLEGMKVGDFGTGSGHYARAIASIVGHSGKVYAVDIQQDVLTHVIRNTHAHHQSIITTVWGDIEKVGGTHLREASLDAVVLANVLFQISDRATLFTELRRVLKPGAKLLVVDWAGSYGGIGPASEHVVSEHKAEELFIGAGFHKVKSFRAGAHHYGILFSTP